MKLCIITPRLPPAMDGLGDYCHQLYSRLRCIPADASLVGVDIVRFGTGADETATVTAGSTDEPDKAQFEFSFLVLDGADATRKLWNDVQVQAFMPARGDLKSQLDRIGATTVILQYVGYGYAPDGAPLYLAKELADWKSAHPEARLFIMFHETWATGMPWQRVFWQMGAQRQSVADLLKVCDVAVASVKVNADAMRSIDPKKDVRTIGIGSSFNADSSAFKNWRRLLIFGKPGSRRRALKNHAQLLKALDGKNLLDEIVCAGQCDPDQIGDDISTLRSLGVKTQVVTEYNFAGNSIPQSVQTCGLSIMHTQSTYMLKSTSFQLAAQLGQVAITTEEHSADAPFVADEHFLCYSKNSMAEVINTIENQSRLCDVAAALNAMYEQCLSWNQIALSWAKLLLEAESAGKMISNIRST